MLTIKHEDLELNRLLKDVLKDKPKTPECKDDEEYGRPLVWTKEGGWKVE